MKNREVIEEMYYSYLGQKKSAGDTILHNEKRIEEIEAFLGSVADTDTDLKFFSPFDTDDIYNGRVEQEKNELAKLREDIRLQEELIRDLDRRIAQFKEMLEEESEKPAPKKEEIPVEVPVEAQKNVVPYSLIYNIQEKERFRLSSELHDNTVQNLVHVCHQLELASMFIGQDPVRAKLEIESCIKNIHGSIDEIRDIIFDLRPMSLDDLGFKACLENYVDNMKVSYPDVAISLDIDEIEKDNSFLLNLFTIIKEIVVNSLKHSGSSKIDISVKKSVEDIDVLIKDYGVGFDPNTVSDNHFGLDLVKDRVGLTNGIIEFKSNQNEGTEVHLVFKEK
ncbi:MAG: hypothetical protein K6A38_01630 [Lachnospiraceae bacterium]|nr:hypothetical protein [Lachnospiraceae bacterium]